MKTRTIVVVTENEEAMEAFIACIDHKLLSVVADWLPEGDGALWGMAVERPGETFAATMARAISYYEPTGEE